MTDTVSQLVITDLAAENALLHERVGSLEQDVRIYRELASEALTLFSRTSAQLASARRQLRSLRSQSFGDGSDRPTPGHSSAPTEAEGLTVQ